MDERLIEGSDAIRGLALENVKNYCLNAKMIGKLNVVKPYFKKYSIVKLVTTHIFSIYSLFIQSLLFELKIINKKFSSSKAIISLNTNCDNTSKH